MINLAIFGFGGQAYFRRVVEEALRFAHGRPEIRFRVIEEHAADMFRYPDLPELHGAIAPTMSEKSLAWFRDRGAPVLFTSTRLSEDDLPPDVGRVCADDRSIGEMAASHFMRVGLAHAGFFGLGDSQFAQDREQGFREAWMKDPTHPRGKYAVCLEGNEALKSWVSGLPKPIGIFCDQDHHAKTLVQWALENGLRVPDDLAVIGVDAGLVISELSPVRLTSVEPDAAGLAREAVETLVRLVQTGGDPGQVRVRIPPSGIAYRESAPYHYSTRPEVNRVLQRMEQSLDQPLRMEDLAKKTGLSRRSLENRFRQTVGMSPYQKLLEMRLDLAKRLLLHSNKTMSEIAEACGFSNAREFSVRFKSKVGMPPKRFREQE